MAVPPKTDEAFLREVDEELRRDQLASAWTRYGRWLVVAVVVVLAAFAGLLWWQHHKAQVAGAQGEQLQAAFDDLTAQHPKAAEPVLAALATSAAPGYSAVARFTQADLRLQANDLKGAAAKFAAIASDTSVGQPLRDLALIRQTSAEFDTMNPQVVVARLRGLATAGNPWFGSAGEMVAVAYLRMGRRDLAGVLFGQIADDDKVPATIRQRAIQIAGVMGVDAVASPEEKKAQ